MPTANIFDTAELVQLVPNLKVAQNFLLDKFFPNVVESTTEFVSIDIDVGKRRMAPFCSPLVEGRLVESRKYQTNTLKPAYIKDKRAPDLLKPIRRQIGEQIGGQQLNPAQREMLNLQFEMADQIDMLNRRLEWMGASALCTGTVTIAGEGYETTVVDFGRSAELTLALSGDDVWPTTLSSADAINTIPSDDIEEWQTLILQKSGTVVTDIVFTNKSWKAFKLDSTVRSSGIIMPALNPSGNIINPGSQILNGAVYKGHWGQYDLWLYNDWYIDPTTDTEMPMVPDGGVILAGQQMQGTRAFASIIDPKFNYGAMAYAPKSWVQEDPAQRFIMLQSSPIVFPGQANGSLYAKVV